MKYLNSTIPVQFILGINLLINLPSSHLAPLQHIPNTAARLITRTRKYEHITPIIRSLHWLPLQQRIKFKIIMLTYKAFHKLAPSNLSALITPKTRTSYMRLRSSSTARLHLVPGPRTHTRYGNRAFSVCAPPPPHFGTIFPMKYASPQR